MKILHVCLAAFYIDNYGYQENILPKMHKLQGYDVEILASTENYLDGNKLSYVNPSVYLNENNIKVTRIPYINYIPHFIAKKIRIYNGVYEKLNSFNPEIIFLHDIQFLGIHKIIKYVKKHPNVKIFADGHADFTNSARNYISKYILHKIIYKKCAQTIDPYVTKFFGTLPCRVDFFKNFYQVSPEKVELLVMGVDDTLIDSDIIELKEKLFSKHGIKEQDFVVISGGKMDKKKNIHHLVDAIYELDNPNIKLILFGKADKEISKLIHEKIKHNSIIYLEWLDNLQIHQYLSISNLCVFPGKHSVLWEQSVGLGIPGLFKKIKGHQHIDLDGNCILLENGDKNEIKKNIIELSSNSHKYKKMKEFTQSNGKKYFSYYEIAKRAINE